MTKRTTALLGLLLGGLVALMLFVVLPTARVNVGAAVTGSSEELQQQIISLPQQ